MTLTAIDELRQEHAVQLRMLAILERIARDVRAGAAFPGKDVAELLTFFREFVETYHHAKEDEALLPLALEILDDEGIELVGQLMGEHQETKELMYSLTLFWEPGDLIGEERQVFDKLVRAYVQRFRRHIEIEEGELFPRLGGLDPERMRVALTPFANRDPARRGLREWRSAASRLEERYVAD